jgi:predicted protein tyrosine phosphatase
LDRSGLASSDLMIVVTPLAHLDATAARHQPSHVLTLLSPDHEETARREPPFEQHLRLYFHDISEPAPGLIAPDIAGVGAILDFAHGWTGARPLLVHCWAGISRSSAAAFMIACARDPGREREIAEMLRERAPFATPNRLMVELADDLLRRSGRMARAIELIGRGAETFEGSPYQLPVSLPASTTRISTPPS